MAIIINTGDLTPTTPMSADHNHWIYNGLDCCVTSEILYTLLDQIDDVSGATYDLSRALQAPVLAMAMRGLRVNQSRKQEVIRELSLKLAQLEEQLDRILRDGVGFPVNWRSPTQLNKLFYEVLNLPVQKKRNANGIFAPSTDRECLEKLSTYYIAEPIINHILLLRDLGKSLGFLATEIDADGRMRTNFNIAGTNTGRLASAVSDFGTGTNMQNITAALRSIFMADPGMKFANLDLEQADSRNIGALCWNAYCEHPDWGDTAGSYLDACENGDLHTTVSKMAYTTLPWGTRPDREIADMLFYRHESYRQLSKKLGHGSNYLGQPPTMAKHAKLPVQIAKDFQGNYFNAFPVIPAFHQHVFKELASVSHLSNILGRRRFFFGRPNEASTRREAVAFTGQSSTADEINHGMLKLQRADRVQLLVQVHDSIMFQFPQEQEAEIVPWALETLRVPIELKRGRQFVVPTEAMTGWNWGYKSDDNEDGLKKWKGSDSRVQTDFDTGLSLRNM